MNAEASGEVKPQDSPAADGPNSPESGRKRLVAGIAGGTALLVVVAGAAWLMRPTPTPPTVLAATPTEAVRGYLDALAAQDADKALEFALARPADTTWLTRDVLADMGEPLKVDDVSTVEATGDTAVVPARVRFGKDDVTHDFAVTRTAGGWRLDRVTSTIDPRSLPFDLGLAMNGHPLAKVDNLVVFPGKYTFSESLEEVNLTKATTTVHSWGTDTAPEVGVALTAKGRKQALAQASRSLNDCLAARNAAPPGCPNSVTPDPNQTIDQKSVRWKLKNKPFQDAALDISVLEPRTVHGTTDITVQFNCSLSADGAKYQVNQRISFPVSYSVDLEDSGRVIWQSR